MAVSPPRHPHSFASHLRLAPSRDPGHQCRTGHPWAAEDSARSQHASPHFPSPWAPLPSSPPAHALLSGGSKPGEEGEGAHSPTWAASNWISAGRPKKYHAPHPWNEPYAFQREQTILRLRQFTAAGTFRSDSLARGLWISSCSSPRRRSTPSAGGRGGETETYSRWAGQLQQYSRCRHPLNPC